MIDITDPKALPANPSITHLKKQAKALKKAFLAGDPEALSRVSVSHPDQGSVGLFALRDAQVTIAREYGFAGWHQLSTTVGERMVEERDLHRWFGVHLNNGMWGRIDDPGFGPDSPMKEREDALYAAYASAYHWRNVGDEANWARGEHLISRIATKTGEYEVARRHAQRCLDLISAHPDKMEDWDAPFAHEALARALGRLGDLSAAQGEREKAEELTSLVKSSGDREVLESALESEPWFGLAGS